MNITGFHVDRESGIYCSNGKHCAQPPYLEFLLENKGDINALSNLDADVAGLLGLMGLTPKELQKLHENESLYIAPWTLKYFPEKTFGLTYGGGAGRQFVNFCDAGQYSEELRRTEDRRDEAYGFTKANMAAGVATEAYDALAELGFSPKNLISPANVFRKERYDTGLIDLPRVTDVIRDEVLEYAFRCCKGTWVESHQMGHWNRAFDYDISTAFAGEASKLYDLRDGYWMESDEYLPDAVYGYIKAEVMIDAPFSPIIYKIDESRSYTPTGIWTDYITKAEYEFIHKWSLGYATALKGYYWFPKNEPRKPFEKAVHWLHREKQTATGRKKDVIKRMLAGSFYGLLLQPESPYFMSPYASEIETNTRLRVADPCLRNSTDVIAVIVDGIVTSSPLPPPLPSGGLRPPAPPTGPTPHLPPSAPRNGLGKWRLNQTGRCLSLGTGQTVIEGKKGEGDLSIDYQTLRGLIEENPNASEWYVEGWSVVSLGKAVAEKRLQDVGKVERIQRSVGLLEAKRDYPRMPRTGKGVLRGKYSSRPWSAGMLGATEEMMDEEKEIAAILKGEFGE